MPRKVFAAKPEKLFMSMASNTYADAAAKWTFASKFLWNAVPDKTSKCEDIVSAKRLQKLFATMSEALNEGRDSESVWQAGGLYIVAAMADDEEDDQ